VIGDILAACHWIVANPLKCSQTAFQGDTQYTPEIVFAGASAGGWCALVAALHFCAQQSRGHGQMSASLRPKALLLLYPMLCLSSPRWCQPVFAAPEPMCKTTLRDKLASADQQIKDGEISLGEAFPTSEEEMRTRKRLPLLWAIMQSGRWLDYLVGAEGFATDVMRSGIDATIEKWNDSQPQGNNMEQLFPLDFADFTNLSTTVPTTIIHGTEDLEIPISESETLVKRIEDAQVGGTNTGGVKLYRVEGAGHVFDLDVDPRDVEIDNSSMEDARGTEQGYTHVLAEALRELCRVTE
jgi:acetyl esterase/lipase